MWTHPLFVNEEVHDVKMAHFDNMTMTKYDYMCSMVHIMLIFIVNKSTVPQQQAGKKNNSLTLQSVQQLDNSPV